MDLDALIAKATKPKTKPKAKPKARTRATPQQTSVTWQPSAALSQRIDAMVRQMDEGGAEKRAWRNEGSKRWQAQAQVLLDQSRYEDYAKAMTGHGQRSDQLFKQSGARDKMKGKVTVALLDEFLAALERLPAKQRKIEAHALDRTDQKTPFNQEWRRLSKLLDDTKDRHDGLEPWLEPQEQGSRALDLDALIAKATTGKPQKPSDGPLRITRYIDYFKLHEAPYVLEDRISERGNSYTAKVYLPEAYTAAYMETSDETGRLLRWGVELSDERIVSRDGAFRIRFPERWARIAGKLQRARGERRHQLAAEELWKAMEPAERQAILDLDLSSYIEGVGANAALRALQSDLKESGSLLWWARAVMSREENPHARLRDAYAIKYLGGPVLSAAWTDAPWNRWVAYKAALSGREIERRTLAQALEAAADPSALPLFVSFTRKNRFGDPIVSWAPHPWISSLREYVGTDSPVRSASLARLRPIITARLGGPWSRQDRAEFPRPVPQRQAWWQRTNARHARMNPADRAMVRKPGTAKGLLLLFEALPPKWTRD